MKNKISVLIPFLNEEENITSLVEGLGNYFLENRQIDAEVIFIDDGSKDKSVELLKNSKHNSYSCKIISLSKNYGSHAALRAGILNATGEYICFMYADLQDPLALINQMLSECEKGFDICWATRTNTNNGFLEKTFSRVYSFLMKKYAIASYPEKGFDIVMFNHKVKEQLNHNIEANSSLFLQILTLGFNQISIFYEKVARIKGKSKWTLGKKIKLMIDSFVAFSYAPIRFVTVIGVSLFCIGIVWSLYLILRKIIFNDLESGWPALVSILMIGFGITNISLGIIAEYLWRTLDSSRKRPVFIINEIFEVKNESN